MADSSFKEQALHIRAFHFLAETLSAASMKPDTSFKASSDVNAEASIALPTLHDREYTVEREANIDAIALDTMTKLYNAEQGIASKYGLKPFTKESLDEIANLREKIETEGDSAAKELTERYRALETRGANEESYNKYLQELQQQFKGLSTPESQVITLGIDKDVFRTIGGSDDYREGGWVDGECYDPKARQRWIENGFFVQTTRGGKMTDKLAIENVFDPKTAQKIEEHRRKAAQYKADFFKNKIGSKVLVCTYGGMVLWIMWFKWIAQNEREIDRQKVQFAYRTLDEEAPLTKRQLAMLEGHSKWARSYYEDEEEEEESEKDE